MMTRRIYKVRARGHADRNWRGYRFAVDTAARILKARTVADLIALVPPETTSAVMPLRRDVDRISRDGRRVRQTVKAATEAGRRVVAAAARWRTDRMVTRTDPNYRTVAPAYWRPRAIGCAPQGPSKIAPGRSAAAILRDRAICRQRDLERFFDSASVNATARIVGAATVGVDVESAPDWNGYRGSCRFPKMMHAISVRVSPETLNASGQPPIIMGGLATLRATPLAADLSRAIGVDRAWQAVWAQRSRGIDWRIRFGYMAQVGDEYAHGRTLAACRQTLRRRATLADPAHRAACDDRTAKRQRRIAAVADRLSQGGALTEEEERTPLRWRHARAAGACESGICAWVARHFPTLNPRRDSVTCAEALRVEEERDLVISAVAVAIGRA